MWSAVLIMRRQTGHLLASSGDVARRVGFIGLDHQVHR
jgi:hypothetical protein